MLHTVVSELNRDKVLLYLVELQYDLNSTLFEWSEKEIQTMIEEGLIKQTPVGYKPAVNVFSQPQSKSKPKRRSKPRKLDLTASIKEWVTEYQKIFKDAPNGSMGSKSACIGKLNQFMIDHPEYSKDHIIKAAKAYVDDCIYNNRYCRYPQYFIYKTIDGVKSSELLDWLEKDVEELETYDDNSDLI